ncbi:MAG: hypothetical protein KF716_27075 [Anaerolineae bacterium]|nr:hypothetical protein [Anaerolineae bacterium]
MKYRSLVTSAIVLLLLAMTVTAVQPSAADDSTPTATPASGKPPVTTHNARYCEFLTVKLKGTKLVASVYNTLGLNDCPAGAWKAIDVNSIRKQFSVAQVLLNGPRYFMMDQIIATGASQSGETVMVGGLGFTKRAEVEFTLTSMKSIPYQEREIQRDTQYIFKQGQLAYQLTSPDGHVYVMQSYSQQADPTLTIDDLPTLATRLKLPEGWKYQEVKLDNDLVLSARGVAHLIQDDLINSYQRIEPADLVANP